MKEFNMKCYALKTFGIELKESRLTLDEEILLERIREYSRVATYRPRGIVHEPEYRKCCNQKPVMADIGVDEEFSRLCSERLI